MRKSIGIVDEIVELYPTANDTSLDHRVQLTRSMNQMLASAIDLQMQMKQTHWNIKGSNFMALHELFDRAYQEAEGYVDTIAERIVQFGGIAQGTLGSCTAATQLPDYTAAIADGTTHIDTATRALSTFGSEVRKMISEANELEDAGTADIFTEISRGIDKMLWFVEAHSQVAPE